MLYSVLKMLLTIKIASMAVQNKMDDYDEKLYRPLYNYSIIMPSYNEARFIEIAAMSIRNQSIIQAYPEHFELILVDFQSTDNTVQLAAPYVDKVFIVGKGKLEARRVGTLVANGDIIVSVDSDTYYPYAWLNSLLSPFNNPTHHYVVGVTGSSHDFTIPNIPQSIYDLGYFIDRTVINPTRMSGRNSAYFKSSFYSSGEFNYNINQSDIHEMVNEEEIQFGIRLSKLGPVIFKANANCYHLGGQKIGCRIGTTDKQICDIRYKIGKDRF